MHANHWLIATLNGPYDGLRTHVARRYPFWSPLSFFFQDCLNSGLSYLVPIMGSLFLRTHHPSRLHMPRSEWWPVGSHCEGGPRSFGQYLIYMLPHPSHSTPASGTLHLLFSLPSLLIHPSLAQSKTSHYRFHLHLFDFKWKLTRFHIINLFMHPVWVGYLFYWAHFSVVVTNLQMLLMNPTCYLPFSWKLSWILPNFQRGSHTSLAQTLPKNW